MSRKVNTIKKNVFAQILVWSRYSHMQRYEMKILEDLWYRNINLLDIVSKKSHGWNEP